MLKNPALLLLLQDDKGASKGFAFVNFKEPESAAKCVAELQNKEYKTKNLYAGRAQKKSERMVSAGTVTLRLTDREW